MGSTVTTRPPTRTGHSHRGGLRTVAVLEAVKGVLALFGAFVLTRMIHQDVDFESAVIAVLFHLHINPDRKLPRELLNAADKLSTTSIALIFAIAIIYATLRFIEGYGLWRQRAWAEWLAIASGCAYIPFEVYKLASKPSELHWIVLGVNILVVLYIAFVRWDEIAARRKARLAEQSKPSS